MTVRDGWPPVGDGGTAAPNVCGTFGDIDLRHIPYSWLSGSAAVAGERQQPSSQRCAHWVGYQILTARPEAGVFCVGTAIQNSATQRTGGVYLTLASER
jgi:hypothetical protein